MMELKHTQSKMTTLAKEIHTVRKRVILLEALAIPAAFCLALFNNPAPIIFLLILYLCNRLILISLRNDLKEVEKEWSDLTTTESKSK